MLAACDRTPQIPSLHYLPGFVPGSENIFEPKTIAVIPTHGLDASDKIVAGGVYDQNGNLIESVVVGGIEKSITAGLERSLADAGLHPVAANDHDADFVLSSHLMSAAITKQFGAEQTVHGQYFTMDAAVTIAFELRDRAGKAVFSKTITGSEHEPPKPVGHEVFFPLETDPVEALSVAMSRTIGGLVVDPALGALMPARSRPRQSPAP
ncbi:MAG TPA: hypothetical protein VMA09_06660 [Candidatus Binataceae bacterium]|nr:hypothetical protein [Candidatus Binataceae bacterium]